MIATEKTAKSPATRVFRRGNLAWLAAYLIVMIGVVVSMLHQRRVTLSTMNTPEARAQWQAWRDAPPNQRADLPVRRRPPSTDEPPALILMRDYFGVMMSAAVVFGSLLFATIMFSVRGVLWRDASGQQANASTGRSHDSTVTGSIDQLEMREQGDS